MPPSEAKGPPDGFRLIWDLLLFGLFVATCAPSITGVPAHEWVSIALIPVLVVHLLSNWEWIVSVSRRTFRRLPGETRFNHILDLLLFVSFALLMLSGLLVSVSALPALGLTPAPDPFWSRMHNGIANLFPSLIGIHVAMHARWVITQLRRKPVPQPATHSAPR